MSRQDVIREFRESEGDPHVRSRRRAAAEESAAAGHLAGGDAGERGGHEPDAHRGGAGVPPGAARPAGGCEGEAPGWPSGSCEWRRGNNIPVVQNVNVARALYKAAQLGDFIPSQLFQAVAEILAVVYRKAQERKARHAGYGVV